MTSYVVLLLSMLGCATLSVGYILWPLGRAAATTPTRRLILTGLLAVGLIGLPTAAYLHMGSPSAVNDATAAPPRSLDEFAQTLQQRVQTDARNVTAWHLLGQTELARGQAAAAVTALEQALRLAPNQPDVQVDLADALGQMQGSRLEGRPIALIRAALLQAPQHPKALALAGAYAVVHRDLAGALQHWTALLDILPTDSEQAAQIRGFVADLQAGRAPQVPDAPTASLRATVRVAPALAAQVDPQATLFISARVLNAQGQPSGPPISVLRTQASQLPGPFVLDDRHAMSPSNRLSDVPSDQALHIVARITRSGQAEAQAGDLQGRLAPVHRNGPDLDLVIDTVIGQ